MALAEQQNWKCCFCGINTSTVEHGTPTYPTIEHVIPKSQLPVGKKRNIKNLVMSCFRCNSLRGDKDAYAFAVIMADTAKRNRYFLERYSIKNKIKGIENALKHYVDVNTTNVKSLIKTTCKKLLNVIDHYHDLLDDHIITAIVDVFRKVTAAFT